jgi:hypothetical protein
LRVLRVLHCAGLHVVVAAVQNSRIEELDLDGSTIAVDDLRALAAAPSLRVLTYDLRVNAGNENAVVVAALAQLHQLAQLRLLLDPGHAFPDQRLRAALPSCDVTSIVGMSLRRQFFTQFPR